MKEEESERARPDGKLKLCSLSGPGACGMSRA